MYMTVVRPVTVILATKQTVVIRVTAKLQQIMLTDLAVRSAVRVLIMQQQAVRHVRSVRQVLHPMLKVQQRLQRVLHAKLERLLLKVRLHVQIALQDITPERNLAVVLSAVREPILWPAQQPARTVRQEQHLM